jgi:hypothetical protein
MGNSATVSPRIHQHFIVGGTIKAATSSLFNYISAHPQVCGSMIKETWFFSVNYTGDPEQDHKKYASYFHPTAENTVLFEASPEYLAYRENVAPRIRQLLPDAKLLFVLRNPVDRLYSSFNFDKGKLQLPQDLNFEDFIEHCERYNNDQTTSAESGIAIKHLRALEIGNYGRYLANFYQEFEAENIKVMFYEEFESNPLEKLVEIAEFIGISPSFYHDFIMSRSNVTFSAKMKPLHHFALSFNRMAEPLLRQYPAIKRSLVKLYKAFNQDQQGYVPMQEETRKKLVSYYAPSNAKVRQILDGQKLPSWIE